MNANLDAIAGTALRHIDESPHRVIPTELERYLRKTHNLNRSDAKTALRKLVLDGHLAYRWELGHAFIERSFHHPVRTSEHVVLCPSGFPFYGEPDDALVILEKGAAFGTGRHPTTQLSLKAIDRLLTKINPWTDLSGTQILDVGTGSGVLLFGAIRLGINYGYGIDREPCAVYEAKQNALLNRLDHRVHISDTPLEGVHGRFDLICANLRFPTLIEFSKPFCDFLKLPGALVLSGMKEEEVSEVTAVYGRLGVERLWRDRKNGWAALIFGNWRKAGRKLPGING